MLGTVNRGEGEADAFLPALADADKGVPVPAGQHVALPPIGEHIGRLHEHEVFVGGLRRRRSRRRPSWPAARTVHLAFAYSSFSPKLKVVRSVFPEAATRPRSSDPLSGVHRGVRGLRRGAPGHAQDEGGRSGQDEGGAGRSHATSLRGDLGEAAGRDEGARLRRAPPENRPATGEPGASGGKGRGAVSALGGGQRYRHPAVRAVLGRGRGGGAAAFRSNRLTSRTIRKIAAATMRKLMTTLMNWP